LGDEHTILLSTHILPEVEAICERVIIINSGRIGFSKTLAELESQALIVLEVRGPTEQVANALRNANGVTQVIAKSLGDGWSRFEVRTLNNQDLREALCKTIFEKGWTPRRLELQRRRLEDAFFDVLREENPLKHDESSTAIKDMSEKTAITSSVE